MADIGTGVTLAFATTTTFTPELISVSGSDISRVVVDSSHMGLAAGSERTKLFGDLFDAGSVECEIQFVAGEQPPLALVPEQLTITFPIPAGMSSAATIVGTGAIVGWSWSAPLEDLMTASFTWTWDGLTGPTVSAAA